jgi:hypothetical protein
MKMTSEVTVAPPHRELSNKIFRDDSGYIHHINPAEHNQRFSHHSQVNH